MSAKAITEATGKDILNRHLNDNGAGVQTCRFATVNMKTDWSKLAAEQPWLLNTVRDCFQFKLHNIQILNTYTSLYFYIELDILFGLVNKFVFLSFSLFLFCFMHILNLC